jgi:hypothetical protein
MICIALILLALLTGGPVVIFIMPLWFEPIVFIELVLSLSPPTVVISSSVYKSALHIY